MKRILTLTSLLCIGMHLFAGDLKKSEPSKTANPTSMADGKSSELHSAKKATLNGCPTPHIYYWRGIGSSYGLNSGANSQWIRAGNWSVDNSSIDNNATGTPPTACDSVVISINSNVDIRMSANGEANGMLFKVISSGVTATLYTNANTLTINGAANINVVSGAIIGIGTDSTGTQAGKVVFLDDVNLGSTAGGTARFVGNANSTMQFGANVTLGPSAEITHAPGTAIFEKTIVGDSIIHLNYNTSKTARFHNVTVREITILTPGGSNIPGNITGDLSLIKHGTLRLNNGTQFNRQTAGGTFLMDDSSKLYVQGLSSVSNGGLPDASLPQGSNFPGGFTTYDFIKASTVYYSGGVGTPQVIYSIPTYNGLTIRIGGIIPTTITNSGVIETKAKVFLEKNATWILGNNINHGNKFVVRNFANLVTGNYALVGIKGFQLDDDGTLTIGSPDGITSSGATGNIRCTGARSYSSDAHYVYNGTSHQVTGNGLPATQKSLTINNSSNVELSNDTEPTELLTLTSGNLEIKGHTLTVNDISYASGRLVGSDTSNITVKGSDVLLRFYTSNKGNYLKDLIIANNAKANLSKTLGDTLYITGGYDAEGQAGEVALGSGSQLIINSGYLALRSNEFGTASLSEVPVDISGNALATITGDVIVERFINVGTGIGQHGKKWHLLATPTSGQTIKGSWMENGSAPTGYGIQLTSPSGTGWDNYSPSPSIKHYDYTNNSWIGAINATDNLYQSTGWMVFIRGDRYVTGMWDPAKPTTLRSKGTLSLGTKTITIPAKTDGFYAIGNPYASAVDARLVDGLGTTGTFYIWNPNPSGIYDLGKYEAYTYLAGDYVSSDGGIFDPAKKNNFILSGQAFFVQTEPSSTYDLIFKEAYKAETNTNKAFYRGNKEEEPVSVLSSRLLMADGTPVDGTTQIFGNEFSDEVNIEDARKLINSGINLSVKQDNRLLAVERKSMIRISDTIRYNLTGLSTGSYKFSFNTLNLSESGLTAWLEDNFTQSRTEVTLEGNTEIPFQVTSASGSRAADRFSIVFSARGALPVTFLKINASKANTHIDIMWNVGNENNVDTYVVMRSIDGIDFTDIAEIKANGLSTYKATDDKPSDGYNYYKVRSTDFSGATKYSEIARVYYGNATPSLMISPNPVSGSFINIRIENEPAGKYSARIFNTAGQVLSTHSFEYPGGIQNERIKWNPGINHGNYNLEIKYPDGSQKTMTILY
ncbi:MAG: T9SS type A sorting domain-containing protein [Chitinophagaceae bacterium]|nr:T9SS type A sorting domain-containing protein [Chitinophagaceae bacterium]MCZ2396015.1 T9SS type A sorting domain-containing protein [Chitinophagales bacterium]